MIHKMIACLTMSAWICAASTFTAASGINGVFVRTLHKPAAGALREEAFAAAADSLKRSLHGWLLEAAANPPDLENAVEAFHFNAFGDSCLGAAREDSYLEGREWTVTYTIDPDTAQRLLAAHNARSDSLAAAYWNLVQEGQKHSRWPVVYNGGIHALFYSMGNFSAADANPTLAASRGALQKLLDKLTIRYSNVIIQGKPGHAVENTITATALVDSMPLAGLILTAKLPAGEECLTVATNSDGVADFAQLRIPFVPYGSFLHIKPNFGEIISPARDFEPEPFGVTLTGGQDQELIFNIVTQTYSLDYSANSIAQLPMPAGLRTGDMVRAFLQDSCHCTPAPAGQVADLAISLQLQSTSYTYDELEETRLKTEMSLVVNQAESAGATVEKALVVHEQSYDSNHEIPVGLYFWETRNKLRQSIRNTLNEL